MRELDMEFSQFSAFYSLPFKATIDTKLREFQFKLLYGILYTNYDLFRMTSPMVDNPRCTFCQRGLETRDHLFYQCEFSRLFLTSFQNVFRKIPRFFLVNK